MEQPITAVIGGLGVRGYEVYASYARRNPDKIRIVAVADPDPAKRTAAREAFGLAEESCYESMEALLEAPRLGDVAVIATQDRQHVRHAVPAMEKGYHLLLEKPVSPDLQECLSLRGAAHRYQRIVAVAHVLRYTQIFSTVKQLLDANAIGRLIHMDLIENVAYWHFAHSYVRGNWRRAGEASPMILAKSCHDLDLLRWLAGDTCISLSSVGGLSVFFAQNAPKGAARRCTECRVRGDCPYNAVQIYMDNEKTGILHGNTEWPCSVLVNKPTEEKLYDALRTGPYGRCVYRCDNDVVDHQVVSMRFAGGATATFTMSAFTAKCYRSIKVMGTMGEIEGDMDANVLYLRKFGQPEQVLDLGTIPDRFAGHGGGDALMMDYVCELIAAGGAEGLTSVDASVESHVMALAAEHSRTHGGSAVELAEFTEK